MENAKKKIFISVLGSGHYLPVKYYFGKSPKGDEPLLRFVQEAFIRENCGSWVHDDQAFFFVTKGTAGSREINWTHPAHNHSEHPDGIYQGLSARLEELNPAFKYSAIDIPDGFSEDEIWEIFTIVFNTIKNAGAEEVYFDVTHAFRSIPLLVMVLINYSKFLLNIEVKNISYGAFEKLGQRHEVKKIPEAERYAPVLDLKSLSELQDWTKAASDFVDFGNVDKLSKLAGNFSSDFITNSLDQQLKINLGSLNRHLPKFVNNIQTCRGNIVVRNVSGYVLNRVLGELQSDMFAPLSPILAKLKEYISPFEKLDNVMAGFDAVKWCIKNGLIQQGITMLQETIVTLICEECELLHSETANREAIHAALYVRVRNLMEPEWKGKAVEHRQKVKEVLAKSKWIELLNDDFDNLRELRNDINHCGYMNYARKEPDDFRERLYEYYNNVQQKLKTHAH